MSFELTKMIMLSLVSKSRSTYLINRVCNWYNIEQNHKLALACQSNNRKYVDQLLAEGCDSYERAGSVVGRNGNIQLFEVLLAHTSTEEERVNLTKDAYFAACQNEQLAFIETLDLSAIEDRSLQFGELCANLEGASSEFVTELKRIISGDGPLVKRAI